MPDEISKMSDNIQQSSQFCMTYLKNVKSRLKLYDLSQSLFEEEENNEIKRYRKEKKNIPVLVLLKAASSLFLSIQSKC